MHRALLLPALLVVGLTACKDKEEADVPPGLGPLEENTAVLPSNETVAFSSGEEDDYVYTHARGLVNVALADVAVCVADPDVGVDRRRVSEYTVTTDVDPTYEVSYDVLTTVEDIVTLTYTLTWKQGDRGDGTYGVHWSKTDGDDLLELLEGSVLLQPVSDTSTDVGIIEHLEAALISTEDTEQFTGDFYASILACSHGEALPTYE